MFAGIVAAMIWMVCEMTKPEILPLGAAAPAFTFRTHDETLDFSNNFSSTTLVMLYHPDCGHCDYMLDQFEQFYNELSGVEIFFFTIHKQSLVSKPIHLNAASNITWGTLSRKQILSNFGTASVPVLYIFNRSGQLIYKKRGAVKMEIILDYLENSHEKTG